MKKIIFVGILLILFFEVYSIFFSLDKIPPIRYVDRKSGQIKIEKVVAAKGLKWLYYDPLGRLTLNALVKRKFLSDYYGKKMDSKSSVKKIKPFVAKLNLKNVGNLDKYKSFNDFFTRPVPNLKEHILPDSNVISSPACGKILAFQNVKSQSDFYIKGIRFSLNEFTHGLSSKIKNPVVLIIRLTPIDYHRFYFPINCKIEKQISINGFLYSVSPLALKKNAKVFLENKRTITLCKNNRIGNFIISEVGATFIGSIIQTCKGDYHKKGEEKGYFKFGGSSIVLIFNGNQIKIDNDLLNNTKNGFETTVYAGDEIAKIK